MATAEPTTETGTVSGSDTTTSKEASHMSKAQGQFTIIDYNDALTLTGYIGSNLAKTQMYNPDNGSYTPDWKTKNLVLTPSLYVIGTTADQIATANVTSVKWYVGDSNTAITASFSCKITKQSQSVTVFPICRSSPTFLPHWPYSKPIPQPFSKKYPYNSLRHGLLHPLLYNFGDFRPDQQSFI